MLTGLIVRAGELPTSNILYFFLHTPNMCLLLTDSNDVI